MATTLTRYLKLKVADDLSADAKYNLNRLDSLGGISGATFSVDSTDNLNVRSRGDIIIEPQSPDVGGSNSGGLVQLGVVNHPVEVLLLSSSFKVNSSLKLKSDAVTKYLEIKPVSGMSSDRSLTLDVGAADKSLSVSDSGTVVVIKGDGLLNLVGPLTIGQGGTGSTTAASASFNLLGGLTNSGPSKALRINSAGTALEWFEVAAGGTVTEVNVDVSAIPELSVSGSPITSSGTFTFTKNTQAANKVYASPTSGIGLPEFRSLAKSDLPVLTTTDIGEGTNLYFTEGRAQSAVVVSVLSALDSTHSPSSQAVLNTLGFYQTLITPGAVGQYWTGAKTFADLNVAAVGGLQTALDGKYSTTNPAAYVDASGAKTAAVVNSTAGTETDQAASVSAMKSYVSGVVGGGKVAVDWLTTDGVTKTVTHSLGTRDVTVEIYDENYETIYIHSVVRTDTNTVTLTSSSAPTTSWRVLIRS